MTTVRWVGIATSGRRFRTYVGRLPGGRKIPGGARPIEQIVGFIGTVILTIFAARMLPYNTIVVFACGLCLATAMTVGLSFIKYDGVPVLGKAARIISLLVDRKPVVLAREELDRQHAANPEIFAADDAAMMSGADPRSTS